MRIVHVYGHGYGGGFVANQVLSLKARGHDVSVVTSEEGPFVERLRREGVEVVVIPFGGSRPSAIPRILRAVLQLRRHLKSAKPDVVHAHLIKANVITRLAGVFSGIPVVTELGGPLPLEIVGLRWMDLATAWIDRRIIASSEAIATIYRRYPHTKGKVHVVYYGFDCTPFLEPHDANGVRRELGLGPEAFVVGMVAHMYPTGLRRFREIGLKGHEVFIEAAHLVAQHNGAIQFLIVGDEIVAGGAYRKRLEALASERGLEGRLRFLGHRADVKEVIAAMNLVAVPSLSENLGGAVEPLLMRRPVIASKVGGLPEVVIDGVSGKLVPAKDPEALAQAILSLFALQEGERAEMGERGRALVLERFDLPTTINQLEGHYRALQRRPSHPEPTVRV